MPQTPAERVEHVLVDLVTRDDWITLDDLAARLYVSRSAVSNDLKEVEQRIARFGLAIEKRPHYGMRVQGPEMARRVCLANSILGSYARSNSQSATYEGGLLPAMSDADLIDVIDASVREAIDAEESFRINSMAYQNLLVHIAVALGRLARACQVPMQVDYLESIQSKREYAIAQRIAANIFAATGVELPVEEIAYIAIHLAGKQTIDTIPDGDQGLVVSDDVWNLVSAILAQVWTVFKFDFSSDLELRMNLARHIVPLAVRLRYNMELKNPMLNDIKLRYPLAYAIARDAAAQIALHYGARVSADEIGYIALAFALALERQKTPAPKKNVLVVCASGAGSARLLEYRVRQEFGDYIDRIVVCDVFDVAKVDFSHIDYVFTTVPLSEEVPVPVREVKYFLDGDEARSIKAMLSAHKGGDARILQYFCTDLFFPHVAGETKEQVLAFLIAQVSRVKPVSDRFGDLVFERERVVSTSFGNDVAIPHPLEPASEQTFVCVALLDHPVVWDESGDTVEAVFLSSFTDHDGLEVQKLYSSLANILVNLQAVEHLLAHRTWETLCGLLLSCQDGSWREREPAAE